MKNGCFTKHPLKNGCLEFQEHVRIRLKQGTGEVFQCREQASGSDGDCIRLGQTALLSSRVMWQTITTMSGLRMGVKPTGSETYAPCWLF